MAASLLARARPLSHVHTTCHLFRRFAAPRNEEHQHHQRCAVVLGTRPVTSLANIASKHGVLSHNIMPELPEVENFRRLLLPLAGHETLSLECPQQNPPRSFLTPEQIHSLSGNCRVKNVLRKGKLICMELECIEKKIENQDCKSCVRPMHLTKDARSSIMDKYSHLLTFDSLSAVKDVYLYLHMGMTGRISTKQHVPILESLTETEYPPPHTYLTFKTDSAEASFSDPRKFGSVTLSTSLSEFDDLATDALEPFDVEKLVGQSTGIKAILLNQKRAISGVGNWVADEVLYQSHLHPEQTFLTLSEATLLKEKLHSVLTTAVSCLNDRREFPATWLFHCRWGKRKTNNGKKVKDPEGRNVVFLTAAGRTSAIVPSIQVKRSRKKTKKQQKRSSPKKEEKKSQQKHKKEEGTIPETSNKRRKVCDFEERSESACEDAAGNDSKQQAKRQQGRWRTSRL